MFTQSWTLFQELSHISAQSAIGRDSKKMKLNPVLSGTKYLPFIKSFFVYSWWLYLLRISSTCLNYVILNFFVFTLYFKAIRYIFFFFFTKTEQPNTISPNWNLPVCIWNNSSTHQFRSLTIFFFFLH